MLYAERTWMVNDRMAALTKDKRVNARKKEKRIRYIEWRKAKDMTRIPLLCVIKHFVVFQ